MIHADKRVRKIKGYIIQLNLRKEQWIYLS
jgi:hypothetical protein